MSYFITKSNFLRIAKKVKLTPEQLLQPIYKSQIFILNKLEIQLVLSVKQVLEDVKNEATILLQTDQVEDTYTYVHEYTHYAKYHTNRDCKALNSNFRDILVPVEIKYQAGSDVIDHQRVKEFRDWMKKPEIVELLENNLTEFYNKMERQFNLTIPLRRDEVVNKGPQEISNLSLSEIEQKIDSLLDYSLVYSQENYKRAKILMGEELRLHTYWATSEKYRNRQINPNNTGYSDHEVREVLGDYHKKIKSPLINLLIDYYIVSLNRGLNFDKNIMENLRFQPCRKCIIEQINSI